jgi:hypothetical protein
MTAEQNVQELNRLHQWIDKLPPRQVNLVYRLVEELIESDQDETEYLLSSKVMKDRLLIARESSESVPFEAVREELGI